MSDVPAFVVFTDLDGTLLDHFDYNFDAAKPTLLQLQHASIPVIPNTSKTFAELKVITEQIGLNTPFIVENGAAVYIPRGYFPQEPQGCVQIDEFWCKSFTIARDEILDFLNQLPSSLCDAFIGFSQMSSDQIALETGLSKQDALLASKKQFSEPIKWLGNERQKQQLAIYLSDRGANMLEGGRFFHISGQTNKGHAMQWLTNEFRLQFGKGHSIKGGLTTIALGDSYNDIDMLEVADVAVQIRSHKHAYPRLKRTESLIQTLQMGPEGWAEGINQIIKEFHK